MPWTLTHDEADLRVTVGEEPRDAVLVVGGCAVDARTAGYWSGATLQHGDLVVRVEWGPSNRLTKVELIAPRRIPFEPPPDSPAGRRATMARERPVVFVLRRAGLAALEVATGLLGVSALLSALLPHVDRPNWLRRPGWLHAPDVPAWLRYINPGYWLGKISWPGVEVPGWIESVAGSSKYWLPIAIAVVIAVGEVERRRKRERPDVS